MATSHARILIALPTDETIADDKATMVVDHTKLSAAASAQLKYVQKLAKTARQYAQESATESAESASAADYSGAIDVTDSFKPKLS